MHDAAFVAQPANAPEYAIFLFKDQNTNSTDKFRPTWIGMADYPPSLATVYLQIFNRSTLTWETVDFNNSAGSREEFTLSAWVDSSLDDYYDGSDIVSCRVYQDLVVI